VKFVLDNWVAILIAFIATWLIVASAARYAARVELAARDARRSAGRQSDEERAAAAQNLKDVAAEDVRALRDVLYKAHRSRDVDLYAFSTRDRDMRGVAQSGGLRGRFADCIAAAIGHDLDWRRERFNEDLAAGPAEGFNRYIDSLRYHLRETAELHNVIRRARSVVGLLEPAPADSWYHPHPSDELLAAVANTPDLGKLTPEDWNAFGEAINSVSVDASNQMLAIRNAIKDAQADRIAAAVFKRIAAELRPD